MIRLYSHGMRFICLVTCSVLSVSPLSSLLMTGPAFAQDNFSSKQADFQLVKITDGLNRPWALQFLPGGEYLVSEKPGNLMRLSGDGDTKTPISGVPDVYFTRQGGLLDILLAPDFEDGDWLYFCYAAALERGVTSTEVARARLNLAANTLEDVQTIFVAKPKIRGPNHWGCRMVFAPDGKLHVTLGDRYNFMDEAQSLDNHLGTTIRINPDGSVPDDNPFIGKGNARPEIFTYGHRNGQGLDVHPETGDLWMHEHGPKGGDEVNILKAGENYAWPEATYGIDYDGSIISRKQTLPGTVDPIHHWTPSIAPCGMTFYTGDKFPDWRGDLFIGALVEQHLHRLELDGDNVVDSERLLQGLGERIRDVRQGPQGYLYILTDSSDAELYRLEPTAP